MSVDHTEQSRKPYWEGSRKSFGDRKVLDTNIKGATDICGTKMLFLMEPLKIIGGMLSEKSKISDDNQLELLTDRR